MKTKDRNVRITAKAWKRLKLAAIKNDTSVKALIEELSMKV